MRSKLKRIMTTSDSILVIEDDLEIGPLIRDLLLRENYEVRLVRSGGELDVCMERDGVPGLIILDLMLPGEDGLSICRRIRANTDVPILMLTAKRDEIDRIIGLEVGADDYLGKPFNPRELLARIRAILRRALPAMETGAANTQIKFAGYLFNPGARSLRRSNGDEIDLMAAEYELLTVLLDHPQRVLSREQLLDWTKGRSWAAFDRSIDVSVSRLRRKIEPNPEQPILIKTVRNGGYILAVPVERIQGRHE